jgi:phosphoribosyl 1,2-cyclic phosphodiesterase
MVMKIHNLGSGSSGNALVVQTASVSFLIDCGIAPRKLEASLTRIGLTFESLGFFFVSHEHTDHVRSIRALLKRGVPCVTTTSTAAKLGLHPDAVDLVKPQQERTICGVSLTPFSVSHDAVDPCGIHLEQDGARVAVATDLGVASDSFMPFLEAADLIVLESNHDRRMLSTGPYPEILKRRVRSPFGHLSNDDCGATLRRVLDRRSTLPSIWLAHLSSTNNHSGLARKTVALATGLDADSIVALTKADTGQHWDPTSEPLRPTRVGRQLTLDMFGDGKPCPKSDSAAVQ